MEAFVVDIPNNPTLSNFWTDVYNTDVSISTLWNRYPHAMMSAIQQVYTIRQPAESVTPTSVISADRAAEVMQYAKTHTYDQTAEQYPTECIMHGADIAAITEGELDHSNTQIRRFKEMLGQLRRGHTLTNLLDEYPDIVINGAYDLIHLDKWLKQGIFPN